MSEALMQKHYKKAPITEAIVDLRVTLPEDFTLDKFNDIYWRVKDSFPRKMAFHEKKLVFKTDDHTLDDLSFTEDTSFPEQTSQQRNGFWFRSEDNLQTIQATSEGFSFNQLAPYESWEKLNGEIKRLWEIYKEVCKPLHVTRVASRHIYQINIPAGDQLIELKDYLSTVPEISPNLLHKAVKSFFMQVEIPQQDLDCTLLINEAIAPPVNSKVVTVILDLNLFRQQVWDIDDEDIWLFLEELRHRKNEIFEASITERTRELIS
jgi:uncharacterized protein (TIGR04255 family)